MNKKELKNKKISKTIVVFDIFLFLFIYIYSFTFLIFLFKI